MFLSRSGLYQVCLTGLALWAGLAVAWLWPVEAQTVQPYSAKPKKAPNNIVRPAVIPAKPATVPATPSQPIRPTPGTESGEHVMIVLDASYSMAEALPDGQVKMEAAKKAILEMIKRIPTTTKVGLRIYGDSDNSFTACRATRVIVPLGLNNRTLIANKLIDIAPTGATPISYALQRSLQEDFVGIGGKKNIFLISDGMETCSIDPCDLAVQMVRQGVDVKVNVVGLGIHQDYQAERQLKCVALSTFGKFSHADTAAQLVDSMGKAIKVQTEVEGRIILKPGR